MNIENQVNQYLKMLSMCKVCQIRYLNNRKNGNENLKEVLDRLEVQQDTNCENKEYNSKKKSRQNPCITCLGLFSEDMKTKIMERIEESNIERYQCNGFVISLRLPVLLQIRQLSMWYALIKKFGNRFSKNCSPDIPLKEVAKLILNPIISEKLGKKYDVNGVMISIVFDHFNEELETKDVLKFSELLKSSKKSNCKSKLITRTFIEKHFLPTQQSFEAFEKFVSIPPQILDSELTLEKITLIGPTVFIAGRYRKVSRKISHTPWIIKGKKITEESIQEILICNLSSYFCDGSGRTIFSSSGREDVDVRCLGNGRPFVLEITNAFRIELPASIANDLEFQIDKTKKLSVKNLQIVNRADLIELKKGEEENRKCYRALCTFQKEITTEKIRILNSVCDYEIMQRTPIRVLHRRPLHTRPRTVYSVEAFVDKKHPRVVVLDIVSQAGTYIKELIHGEFGRTSPSISMLVGEPVDIIALDVVGIDLDWPKNIKH